MTNFSELREVALESWRELYSSKEPIILVGNATCGRSAGSIQVQETLEKLSIAHDIPCQIIEVGCIGLCFMEPIVCVIEPNQPAVFFGNITPERVGDLFNSYIIGGYIIEDLVIGTAGDVSTGAVDDLKTISVICKKYDLWFHIDGAYGLPAAVIPLLAPQFEGIEAADSIALDPHKWLYSPLEAGCTLVKNPQHLIDSYSSHPEYYNFNSDDDDIAQNF